MTARDSNGANVPLGDEGHDHPSAEEAKNCDLCDRFVCSLSGLPTRAEREQHGQESTRETLLKFGRAVEKRARQNMLVNGKVEGAHYAAMCSIFPSFGIDYKEDIAKIVTDEENNEGESLLILPSEIMGKERIKDND